MLEEPEAVGLSREDVRHVHDAVTDSARSAFDELWPQGAHPARLLARNVEWLEWIAHEAEMARDVETMTGDLDAMVESVGSVDELYRVLRRFKQRESLRIFLREVRETASMRETAAEIADLAASCMIVALRQLGRLLDMQSAAEEFCVFGMGKLGGRELNFSSDVDLVYVCSDRASIDEAFRREVIELGRALTDAIGSSTEDGYVFRVDLRLRPDGTQGPLVQPVSALANYYLQFGRTWERSAWLKARPVAGNLDIGEHALQELEPFLYRRYLDFGALQELRAMKEQIEANAQLSAVVGTNVEPPGAPEKAGSALSERLKMKLGGYRPPAQRTAPLPPSQPDEDRTGVLGWDVKIGIGGIREIEFFVQALQLVHCGTREQLRVKNTLEALDVLLWAGLIPNDDHAALTDAYDFLRRLEHRIQMEHDRQSHRLPMRWSELDRLAARMGLGRDGLRDAVSSHREVVRRIFERLFSRDADHAEDHPTLEPESPTELDLIARASSTQLSRTPALEALRRLGFERPRQVAGQIQVLREKSWSPLRENAWGGDAVLGRRIIMEAAGAPDADLSFGHFARFAQAVGDRPGYWSMLRDNPHATRLLLQVFGASAYLSTALIRDPNVFERLLAVGTVAVEKSRERLDDELDERLLGIEDPEHRFGIIRRFHREETLRIGLHETGGAAKIRQSLSQLSLLAEVVIDHVAHEVYEPLRSRRRRPGSLLPPIEEIPFAVVAMGKLGGRELGFGSDLDVVFVYEEERQYRLDHTFFARLAQRLVRTLSTASAEGKLYEVDTRLRPSGAQGALVVSLEALRDYQASSAGMWERQALIRARPIFGPDGLRAAVMNLRDDMAFERGMPEDGLTQISTMRRRISDGLYVRGTRDVKFGPGGMVDAEFLTQALQLLHPGEREPSDAVREGYAVDDSVRSQSTMRALRRLAQVLRDDELEQIADDYAFLARVQARLRMTADGASGAVPDDEESLRLLGRRTGHQGSHAATSFGHSLDAAMGRIAAKYGEWLT